MWQQLAECASATNVAFCIPWFGGSTLAIYWYGILAAVGIFVGAFYAAKHVEREGEDPDMIWDVLLFALIAGLLGARLWFVAAELIGGRGATFLESPIEIINFRGGGMNIFGAAVFGLIAILVYARIKNADAWLLTDAGLMGLLLGQGIGRFGNLINQELYGPPTNSSWWGIAISPEHRLAEFQSLPAETRFHPTMLYEAFWLFVTFGVLYYLFTRYQPRMLHGILTGAYLTLAGVGRFIMEFWRPDQPTVLIGSIEVSISRLFAMLYVVVGLIILLDRTGYLKIPFIRRPQTRRQREVAYQEILTQRRRRERALEREREREMRKRNRERLRAERATEEQNTGEESA